MADPLPAATLSHVGIFATGQAYELYVRTVVLNPDGSLHVRMVQEEGVPESGYHKTDDGSATEDRMIRGMVGRDLTHRFPTLDQLEAFLVRTTGSDAAVRRGISARSRT